MAQDFNNIPAGLKITTQIPLDIKENILNESTLSYLGVSNNLAYTYHDKLVVNCLEEGTRYIWREVGVGEENTGLCPLDFTYPSNIIVYGIIYSNKKFNFFKLPGLEDKQLLYTTANIGVGEEVYKNSTITPLNTQFNLKKINSDTLSVTTSLDGDTINIEQPDSGIPMFIVDSSYTGIGELGTQTKPFKSIPQALLAYVGVGTNIAPENDGVQIQVKKGVGYNFTGNFVYKNLNIELDGAVVNHTSTYLLDYDSILDINSTIRVILNNNARINCTGKFLRTKGNSIAFTGIPKNIEIYGDGTGIIYAIPDSTVASPSANALFEINTTNTVGYNNDSVLNIHNVNVISINRPIYIKGGGQSISFNNSKIEYGTINVSQININTSPFNQTGGTILEKGNTLTIYQVAGTNINKLYRISNPSSILLQEDLSIQGGLFEYIFSNETGINYPRLDTNNLRVSNVVNTSFGDSSVVWDNIRLRSSNLNICTIDYTKVKLTSSTVNLVNGKLLETIPEYTSQQSAVVAGLFSGCAFTRSTVKTAGSFVIGKEYKITTIGTTDFTTIGASSNTVGLYFTATGVGAGTGTATNYIRDIVN